MFDNEQTFRSCIDKLAIDDGASVDHQRQVRTQVLTAFDEAGNEPPRVGVGRRAGTMGKMSMNSKILRMAAVLAVVCTGTLAIWMTAFAGADIALADVSRALGEVQSLAFTMTFEWGDETIEGEVIYLAPGKTRMEIPGMTSVIDWEEGLILSMDHKTKSAHRAQVSEQGNPYYRNWFADLQEIVGNDECVQLPGKKLRGRAVQGWRLESDQGSVDVWADAKTAEMIEVVLTDESGECVMGDFRYDVNLAPSLFSLEPPAPYELETQVEYKASAPSLDDVPVLLRAWASGNGNVFPDSLNPAAFGSAAARADWSWITSPAHEQEVRAEISRAFMFLMGGARVTYAGAGVTLWDADTPVLWPEPREGDKTCRVIFGDLKIREVPVEELPRK